MSAAVIRPDAVGAKHISISCCDHGHIYVCLHDDKGHVFAYATIDKPVASVLIDNLFDVIDGVNAAPCREKHR